MKTSVCVCMIVRDEEATVERALSSASSLADSFVILDTGSTDSTMDRVDATLKGRDYNLLQSSWKGFAGSRNEALLIARERSDYVVFLDADDFFVGDALRARAKLHLAPHWVCYSFSGWIRSVVQFAVRTDYPLTWTGERHEYLQGSSEPVQSDAHLMQHMSRRYTHTGVRSRLPDLWHEDLLSLRAQLTDGDSVLPSVACRSIFYQALTLQALGKLTEAMAAFDVRSEMNGGDEEERWFADLCSTRLSEMLNLSNDDLLARYSKLVLQRPERAEVYLDLARRLRLAGRFQEASKLARASMAMPVGDDWVSVDTAANSINAWDELASNLYELGDYQGASKMWRKVLLFGSQSIASRARINCAIADCSCHGRAPR